jgi:hypothetical protein
MYAAFGLVALRVTPNPLVMAIASGVMLNFALAFATAHALYVIMRLLPPELRPGWPMRIGLVSCSVFYVCISTIALWQEWPRLIAWLRG